MTNTIDDAVNELLEDSSVQRKDFDYPIGTFGLFKVKVYRVGQKRIRVDITP